MIIDSESSKPGNNRRAIEKILNPHLRSSEGHLIVSPTLKLDKILFWRINISLTEINIKELIESPEIVILYSDQLTVKEKKAAENYFGEFLSLAGFSNVFPDARVVILEKTNYDLLSEIRDEQLTDQSSLFFIAALITFLQSVRIQLENHQGKLSYDKRNSREEFQDSAEKFLEVVRRVSWYRVAFQTSQKLDKIKFEFKPDTKESDNTISIDSPIFCQTLIELIEQTFSKPFSFEMSPRINFAELTERLLEPEEKPHTYIPVEKFLRQTHGRLYSCLSKLEYLNISSAKFSNNKMRVIGSLVDILNSEGGSYKGITNSMIKNIRGHVRRNLS